MKTFFEKYNKALNNFLFDNDPDKSIKELKKLVKEDNSFNQIYYDLGYIYSAKSDTKKSVRYYKKYLKYNPFAKDKEEIKKIILSSALH